MTAYLTAAPGVPILHKRLGEEARVEGIAYGERRTIGGVTVSFHPAGHILGSAQIRLERGGEVWVVSGDYKRQSDPTCTAFEPVPCHTFITEATFGLPVYFWDETAVVAREVLAWWEENRAAGRPSVLFCYALGKAQRLLAELAHGIDRPIYVHGAVEPLNEIYRRAGISLPPTLPVSEAGRRGDFAGELILAPPSAAGSPWMRRFANASTGFASGWMRVRGARRRGFDRGFVLSDHADWGELLATIRETGAERVLATHGASDVLSRYLRESGLDAAPLATPYAGEGGEVAGAGSEGAVESLD
jgi:putative mRNA 3-end processing factor